MWKTLLEYSLQPVNLIFLIATAICLVVGLLSRKRADFCANLAPTIGMLGTFFGILIGLMSFDSSNIASSVPSLLDGLKTAFLTSIAGLTAYIIVKTFWAFMPKPAVNISTANPQQQVLLELQGIRKALNADQEGSLITQLQKIRASVTDQGEALSNRFDKFAETMAKNNSDALITALKEVISDFNSKLTEQFGDNFKQLNNAVGELVQWQEQYRSAMEYLIPEFKTTCQQLGESNIRVQTTLNASADMLTNLKAIHECTQLLSATVTGVNAERNLLQAALNEFADTGKKAKELLPTVQTSLNSMSKGLEQNVLQLTKEMRAVSDLLNTNMESVSKTVSNTLVKFNGDFDSYLRESSKKAIARLEEQSIVFDERFKKQTENLDALLQEELTKSLNSLGSTLASVSQRFASDYTPLADRLRAVMEIINKQAA